MIAAAKRRLGQFEFTALLAAAMSMTALGIDLLLPAFGDIREGLGLAPDSTAVAGLVTAYFLGLALGQPIYGPASDSFGRKPLLYAGFAVYGLGAIASAVSPTLPILLASRFLWGLGAAGSRTVTLAIVRDRYEGERMSRAMSLIMSVFMLVPVFAPTLGAIGVSLVSWRWLFVACGIAVGALALWTGRLTETLPPEDRREPSVARILDAGRTVLSDRQTVGYTLAMTSLYGSFTSYLGSSEIIFTQAYDVGEAFPLYFGGLAVVMAGAMLLNARVVEGVGSRRLSHGVLVAYIGVAAGLLAVAALGGGTPPLPIFLLAIAAILFGHAILIPNFNSLAMSPMGRVAGMASSLTGAAQIAIGALIGSLIDQQFDGTILPFSVGLVVCAVAALGLVKWAERGSSATLPDHEPAQAKR